MVECGPLNPEVEGSIPFVLTNKKSLCEKHPNALTITYGPKVFAIDGHKMKSWLVICVECDKLNKGGLNAFQEKAP